MKIVFVILFKSHKLMDMIPLKIQLTFSTNSTYKVKIIKPDKDFSFFYKPKVESTTSDLMQNYR